MQYQKTLLYLVALISMALLLIGCSTATTTTTTSTPTSAQVKATSTATGVLASTPTPEQPSVTPVVEATIPVQLAQPVTLVDQQIKLTVLASGSAVGNGAYIQPAHQSTERLLQLTVSIENLTGQQIWFGPNPGTLEEQGQAQTNYRLLAEATGVQTARFIALKVTGITLKVGGVKGPGQNSWGYGAYSVQPGSSIQMAIAFAVPIQATQLTATLITVSFS